MTPEMKEALSFIDHTQFSYETLRSIQAARFTLFDLLSLFGGTRTNADLAKAVDLEWADEQDRAPESVWLRRKRPNGSEFDVETRLLTHLQVIRLMSRMTGDTGRIARSKSERYMEALEALVAELAAEKEKHRLSWLEAAALLREFSLTRFVSRADMSKMPAAEVKSLVLDAQDKWNGIVDEAGYVPKPGDTDYAPIFAVIEYRTKAALEAAARNAPQVEPDKSAFHLEITPLLLGGDKK